MFCDSLRGIPISLENWVLGDAQITVVSLILESALCTSELLFNGENKKLSQFVELFILFSLEQLYYSTILYVTVLRGSHPKVGEHSFLLPER